MSTRGFLAIAPELFGYRSGAFWAPKTALLLPETRSSQGGPVERIRGLKEPARISIIISRPFGRVRCEIVADLSLNVGCASDGGQQ